MKSLLSTSSVSSGQHPNCTEYTLPRDCPAKRMHLTSTSGSKSSGHRILGGMSCWCIQALNIPGRPVLSASFSHHSSSLQVFLTYRVSLWLLFKVFPKLFTSCSKMVGICEPEIEKQILFKTLIFFETNVLDFTGLKDILAHPTRLSRQFKNSPGCRN